MSTVAMSRRVVTSTALVATIGGALAVVLLLQRLGGADSYPTDPIGTVALAGAAVLAQICRERLRSVGNIRAARLASGLTASLLIYLALSVVAIAASPSSPLASVAVAVWSVAWIAPLTLAQVLASSAVRPHAGGPRIHSVVLATSALAALSGAVLWQPIDPFAGVAPLAPDSWPTRMGDLSTVTTLIGFVGLLLLPTLLTRAAAGSRGRARMRLGVAAAGTLAAPLVIVFCIALAIAADPGGVDPSAGSVAFQVAVASGAAAGAVCAYLAAGDINPGHVSVVTRSAALAIAALMVAAVATLVVAAGLPATPTALLVSAVAVAASALAWWVGGNAGTLLSADPPRRADVAGPPPPAEAPASAATSAPPTSASPVPHASASPIPPTPHPAPQLTSREREVLAHLADGASNAGIATQLVVSERTVDAHLRAIFTKLELVPHPAENRRVLAAKLWLQTRADAK